MSEGSPNSAEGLDNRAANLASSGRDDMLPLAVRPHIRLLSDKAGRALAAAQGQVLAEVLARLDAALHEP